jgi:uncharacterized protein with PQ loop repeat
MKTFKKPITIIYSVIALAWILFPQPVFALTLGQLPSTADNIQRGVFFFFILLSLVSFISVLVNLVLFFVNIKKKDKTKRISKILLISFIVLVASLFLSYLVFAYFIQFLEFFFDSNHPIFEPGDTYIKSCYGPTCPWNFGK